MDSRSCTPFLHKRRLEDGRTAVKLFQRIVNGAWRSPVARLVWDQKVPGSNPGAPTFAAPQAAKAPLQAASSPHCRAPYCPASPWARDDGALLLASLSPRERALAAPSAQASAGPRAVAQRGAARERAAPQAAVRVAQSAARPAAGLEQVVETLMARAWVVPDAPSVGRASLAAARAVRSVADALPGARLAAARGEFAAVPAARAAVPRGPLEAHACPAPARAARQGGRDRRWVGPAAAAAHLARGRGAVRRAQPAAAREVPAARAGADDSAPAHRRPGAPVWPGARDRQAAWVYGRAAPRASRRPAAARDGREAPSHVRRTGVAVGQGCSAPRPSAARCPRVAAARCPGAAG